ncbi:DUF5666 domain-containing protein [Piscinibacter sp. HJYY11]|uniref:DUF5666 domain-containing protein n=1 Tax=Piscinibacter sp. HJYY11 TaxID=2801333 RepID=UPI00191E8C99|nr:DUF5666 domain-containing protein [Piscinibacter sp. HJYY11]MBL0726476.1 hypothetical protein [Piscinibacter sp. HJYY11]
MRHWPLPQPWSTVALSLATSLCLLLTAALPGCGGVDSGGTGQTVENPTASAGPITGFGSIIVNGIRYDESRASIVDDDGVTHPPSDLRLGMVVEVQGSVRGGTTEGTASRIQFGQEISGPVNSVNVSGSSLVVLGQTVQVDDGTLFGGFGGGLSTVAPGQLADVYGFQDPVSGSYTATRIERRASLTRYVLRGTLGNLAGPPVRNFSIGTATIDYSTVAPQALPTLSNGLRVRVTLNTTPVSGRWVATSVRTSQYSFPDNSEAKVEGFVSSFTSRSDFLVAGVRVDASAPGLIVRHGTVADLANGVRVRIEGEMRAGVLVADVLDFKRGRREEFELHGPVETLSVGSQTLVLRGMTVRWDGDTRFTGGRVSDLAEGVRVEVRGSAAGTQVLAESIRFERP